MVTIGIRVRILPTLPDEPVWHGKVGTLVEINEHHTDGDFFGVNFPAEEVTLETLETSNHVIYFWREELEVIEPCERVVTFL